MVFLKDRTQSVKVHRENSQVFYSVSTEVEGGVPQGTILGPTLFNIYINNAPQSVKNKMNLYANDLKIISPAKRTKEQALLQADLDKLSDWAKFRRLEFNIKKCRTIHFDRKNMRDLISYA